jgi:RNA polymerase sigma-70 factor (ECF subfamily)
MNDLSPPDGEWLARAQAGDTAAFSQLVRRHQARVRGQLARLTHGDRHRADDLAQQTFVQAWRALGSFRGDARVSTWLHRIAYTCFLQDERARRPNAALDAVEAAEPSEPGDADATPRDARASTDPRTTQLLQIDLARALDRLPAHERVAIIHCCQLDLSHDEAAEVLGLPLGTLKSQVARGKARLRELLAAWRAQEV